MSAPKQFICPICGAVGTKDDMEQTIVQIVSDGETSAERWRVHSTCLDQANNVDTHRE